MVWTGDPGIATIPVVALVAALGAVKPGLSPTTASPAPQLGVSGMQTAGRVPPASAEYVRTNSTMSLPQNVISDCLPSGLRWCNVSDRE